MWEPRHLTNLWTSTACYRDNFTFSPYLLMTFGKMKLLYLWDNLNASKFINFYVCMFVFLIMILFVFRTYRICWFNYNAISNGYVTGSSPGRGCSLSGGSSWSFSLFSSVDLLIIRFHIREVQDVNLFKEIGYPSWCFPGFLRALQAISRMVVHLWENPTTSFFQTLSDSSFTKSFYHSMLFTPLKYSGNYMYHLL
jgi:hypothetical protein